MTPAELSNYWEEVTPPGVEYTTRSAFLEKALGKLKRYRSFQQKKPEKRLENFSSTRKVLPAFYRYYSTDSLPVTSLLILVAVSLLVEANPTFSSLASACIMQLPLHLSFLQMAVEGEETCPLGNTVAMLRYTINLLLILFLRLRPFLFYPKLLACSRYYIYNLEEWNQLTPARGGSDFKRSQDL
ncbi:hypothetical protein C8R42DRAFT_637134 [Lentinula raphanica]|nr:hypothetical protein C8R42DRAFT_637134 [Lentinula raphanica]